MALNIKTVAPEQAYRIMKRIATTEMRGSSLDGARTAKPWRPTVMLHGEPGSGKTALVRRLSMDLFDKPPIILHAALNEATDFKGMFDLDREAGVTRWLRPEFLPAEGDGLIFLDEISQARRDVMAALYPFIYDREIHGYAGIGARATPPEILQLMARIGAALAIRGLVLRSGGAEGADKAFASGAGREPRPEIFTPWAGFNGIHDGIPLARSAVEGAALALARRYHPAWERLSEGARLMQGRNCQQVLGRDLRSRSSFVVCWTEGGTARGGTGQAIRMAEAFTIPVFNLFRADVRAAIQARLALD